MKLNIQNLKDGTYSFEFVTECKELDLQDNKNFNNRINITSQVDKRVGNVVVKTEVTTKADFQCDSCLVDFTDTLQESFTLLYTSDKSFFEADEEDVVPLVRSKTSEIDLKAGVRDALLLAIPIKVICSDECKGLCPECGANLNEALCECTKESVDPRWAGLRKLVS